MPTAVWIGGAAVAVVLAGAAWWVLKPDSSVPAPVDATTTPVEAPGAAVPIVPVEAVPVTDAAADVTETGAEAEAEAAPAAGRPAASSASTPSSTTAPSRTAPTSVAPPLTPRLNTEANVPRIETAPLVVAPAAPPPTAAEAPATDPDAPIQTRPQPLN
ncbi:translation initiation factor IF-2 [Brevundimonas subvibrioides ATCC 15264]|uniref:Translation initiation factor IF-2 n=1 Tax=Brevundimonas subvibrioides (strain ATCC 15264 / DSM 4735 / LMG 14903 / NBRC 16000 / CB 81) TaxID=633149 RepID=D9QFD8_BRESC|nr:translation initiation factor IF-2 [Brevundimonas subvibrioides ATCC 15264]